MTNLMPQLNQELLIENIKSNYSSLKIKQFNNSLLLLLIEDISYYAIIHSTLIELIKIETQKRHKKNLINSIIYCLRYVLLSSNINFKTNEKVKQSHFFELHYHDELNKIIKNLKHEEALLNQFICIYKYHTTYTKINDIKVFVYSLLDYYDTIFPLFENFTSKRLCSSWDYSFEVNSLNKKLLFKDYPECFILSHCIAIQDFVLEKYHKKFIDFLCKPIKYNLAENFIDIVFAFSQYNKHKNVLNLLEENNLEQFLFLLPNLLETYGTIHNPNLTLLMKHLHLIDDDNVKKFFSTNLFIDYFYYFASGSESNKFTKENVNMSLMSGFFDIFNDKKMQYFDSQKDLIEFEVIVGSKFEKEYGFEDVNALIEEYYDFKKELSLLDLLSLIDGFNFPKIEELFSLLNQNQYQRLIIIIKDNFKRIQELGYDKKFDYPNIRLILEKEKFSELLLNNDVNKSIKKL